MRRSKLIKRPAALKYFMLWSWFICLLFSTGEGVRLLPFPHSSLVVTDQEYRTPAEMAYQHAVLAFFKSDSSRRIKVCNEKAWTFAVNSALAIGSQKDFRGDDRKTTFFSKGTLVVDPGLSSSGSRAPPHSFA